MSGIPVRHPGRACGAALLGAVSLLAACAPRAATSAAAEPKAVAAGAGSSPAPSASSPTQGHPSIALVLQITVDQLRGDLPMRYKSRLAAGGLRRLWDQGTVFANAHHAHANTETIVGHATLATGAHPSLHGMIGNVWLDRTDGAARYNIEDAEHPLLTDAAGVDKKVEIDPTQKAARSQGRSPRALLASTFGDELSLESSGRAKVFGVSIKDRAAVAMAGHAGKAFWFSKQAGAFVTSSYYYAQTPAWVKAWNERRPIDAYAGKAWELLQPLESYNFAQADDQPWEVDLKGFGRTFPHQYAAAQGRYFTTWLTTSPAGDELTLDFAKTLLQAEQLGADAVTDYLSVSFSSTDYVGHLFGPSSLESEDNLLRLDRSVQALLVAVDERVGLDKTLVVLSADHGAADAPEVLQRLGIDAGRVDPQKSVVDPVIAALDRRFTRGKELIQGYQHPYIYLDWQRIAKRGLDRDQVAREVADALLQQPVVAYAVTRRELLENSRADTPAMRALRHSFHPQRSGDVHVVFLPHYFIADFDGLSVAATHGSLWSYDTHVPIVFMGPGISPQTIESRVYTVQVAPTLSTYLGITLPSSAFDPPLVEVSPP